MQTDKKIDGQTDRQTDRQTTFINNRDHHSLPSVALDPGWYDVEVKLGGAFLAGGSTELQSETRVR